MLFPKRWCSGLSFSPGFSLGYCEACDVSERVFTRHRGLECLPETWFEFLSPGWERNLEKPSHRGYRQSCLTASDELTCACEAARAPRLCLTVEPRSRCCCCPGWQRKALVPLPLGERGLQSGAPSTLMTRAQTSAVGDLPLKSLWCATSGLQKNRNKMPGSI